LPAAEFIAVEILGREFESPFVAIVDEGPGDDRRIKGSAAMIKKRDRCVIGVELGAAAGEREIGLV
jgi:hypothetical protein